MKYEWCYSPIRTDVIINKPIEKGHRFAMPKKPLEETKNMTPQQQKEYVEKNFPKEYSPFPTTRQGLLYCMDLRWSLSLDRMMKSSQYRR